MDLEKLLAVVLGAVLALVGGMVTELWKGRRAARAAARLIWFELFTAYSVMLIPVATDWWPDKLSFRNDAWEDQRDRLALGRSAAEFQVIQAAYETLQLVARTPREERGAAHRWFPVLTQISLVLRDLGKAAGIPKSALAEMTMPPHVRVGQMRQSMLKMDDPANPGPALTLFQRAVHAYPEGELRERAVEALEDDSMHMDDHRPPPWPV